jgi:hypothetical protein
MRFYDIFNGDADGICALQQLRLAQPRDAELVTGVKRDNRLLARVRPQAGDVLTVLDIALDENRSDLLRVLEAGAACRYFDHHYPGTVPAHPLLEAHIDTSASTCTSLIVDRHLGGAHRAWAVVAAFGDNLPESAISAAEGLALRGDELLRLRQLGECLNYNAYGETPEDLNFHPADLYRRLHAYGDPLDFAERAPEFPALQRALADDLEMAHLSPAEVIGSHGAAVFLPEEKWSRRVSGMLANELARKFPSRAHAVLTKSGDGYVVSLRAPQLAAPGANQAGIDRIARMFAGGNGRGNAAGIPMLPRAQVEKLFDALRATYETPSIPPR